MHEQSRNKLVDWINEHYALVLILMALIGGGIGCSSPQDHEPENNQPIIPGQLQEVFDYQQKHGQPAEIFAASLLEGELTDPSFEITFRSCPNVVVNLTFGTVHNSVTNLLGTSPNSISYERGRATLSSSFLVYDTNWQKINPQDMGSYLAHEVLHLKQDCELLQNIIDNQPMITEAALAEQFAQRWQNPETATESEAEAVAVQLVLWLRAGGDLSQLTPALLNIYTDSLSQLGDIWGGTFDASVEGYPEVRGRSWWNEWLKFFEETGYVE